MQWLLKKIIGTKNERDVRLLRPLVPRINALEAELQPLSNAALQAKTLEFKQRLAQGQTLDDILCEAFAVVKNACRRLCGTTLQVCDRPLAWEMVPFDMQLIGGIVLHRGKMLANGTAAEIVSAQGVATFGEAFEGLTAKAIPSPRARGEG